MYFFFLICEDPTCTPSEVPVMIPSDWAVNHIEEDLPEAPPAEFHHYDPLPEMPIPSVIFYEDDIAEPVIENEVDVEDTVTAFISLK